MRALHSEAHGAPGGLSADLLEKRLVRERRARQAAETLLETKSRELHDAGEALKRAAATLENQKTQLKLILDNTQIGILFTRDDLSIRDANQAACTMFGKDRSSLAFLAELFSGPSDVIARLEDLKNGTVDFDGETREARCIRSDGREFPVEFGIKPLLHESQTHYVCFVRDITRRLREEEKRRALERELSQAQKFEALGTLASGVAHEINTPIQYVSDNLRFLETTLSDLDDLTSLCREALTPDDVDVTSLREKFSKKAEEIDLDFVTEEAPRAASQSLEGLEQVASIVKAIKAFAHPGDDAMVATDLNDAIATTLTVARNRWKYVAEIETDFGEGLSDIPCHVSDMNQVFVNLIVNAADAIEEAGKDGPGLIRIQTQRLDDTAEIRISDNGCGIPQDAMEKIFDPFFTTKDVGKGSGQGLAISYNIIRQKHHGTIACESEAGNGTTIIVTLPTCQSPTTEEC